jgi:hypothetical protein
MESTTTEAIGNISEKELPGIRRAGAVSDTP